MKKKRLEIGEDAAQLYVYNTTMYEDLIDMVMEYMGESEHQGFVASAGEVSKDTIPEGMTMEEFTNKRKELLRKDFVTYWDSELNVLPKLGTKK